MPNLTFQEGLIRKHEPEPLEGHTVVVLQRIGEAGERLHAVLEPGSDRVRGSFILSMLGRPEVYVAFAVDEAHSRLLTFEEHVRMAEHAHDFHLHFSLWYRASEADVLVGAREADPLAVVRRKVAEVVVEEMADQPWTDVWHAFRATAERVVRDTRAELQAFAGGYGIHLVELKLRANYPKEVLATEVTVRDLKAGARVQIAKIEVDREVRRVGRGITREDAGEVQEEDALLASRALNRATMAAYTDKVSELIRSAADPAEVRRVQTQLLGGTGGPAGRPADGPLLAPGGTNGSRDAALPTGSFGLPAVLADIVAVTQPLVDARRRTIRALLLELVAALVADDTPVTSDEQAARARKVQDELSPGRIDEDQREALLPLADPDHMRARLYP